MPAAVTVNLTKLKKLFGVKAMEDAQTKFAMSVAEDMNAYIPKDTSKLHDSMKAASDFKRGLIVWDTDYAAYVRAMPDSRIKHGEGAKNPKARADWPKAAKDAHGEDWKRLAETILTEGA